MQSDLYLQFDSLNLDLSLYSVLTEILCMSLEFSLSSYPISSITIFILPNIDMIKDFVVLEIWLSDRLLTYLMDSIL